MAGKDLRELFHETLKDIYFAEKKILGALAQDGEGSSISRTETRPSRSTRRRRRSTSIGSSRYSRNWTPSPRGKTCDAIMGIIEEGQEVMKEFKGMPALDAGLLAAAQAVEHYEMARYGTLRTWATELGLRQSVKLLDATLARGEKDRRDADPACRMPASISTHRRPDLRWFIVGDPEFAGDDIFS